MSTVKKIGESEFQTEVLQADQPVLVDFYADWCGPCRMLGPVVDQIAQQYEGRIKVIKVDVDKSQNIAAQFQISSIPLLMLFQDGKVVNQSVGLVQAGKLQAMIDPVLSTASS